MGFKEVMSLRQEGRLDEALSIARSDYQAKADQWSASALFWVLKDLSIQLIEAEKATNALPMVNEMEQLVTEMGATAQVAQETVETLQMQVAPHYQEMERMLKEVQETKLMSVILENFQKATNWLKGEEGLAPILHESYAKILLKFLNRKLHELSIEEYLGYLTDYFSLQIERPSSVHSKILAQALEAKDQYESRFSLYDFIQKWDLTNLRQEDWQRKKPKELRSLAENTLSHLVYEFVWLIKRGTTQEIPTAIYQLLLDAQSFYPEDDALQLTQARIHILEGAYDKALDLYMTILPATELPQAWLEFSTLVTDPDVRMGALCCAMRDEQSPYPEYLGMVRIELAEHMIERGYYDYALRELEMHAQISLEKSRPVGSKHEELLAQIPEGTKSNRDSKPFYQKHSRPAEEYVYADIPSQTMIVVDMIALRIERNGKQVVPMLKLMSVDSSRSVLASPFMSGVAEGDNRGKCYEVKLQHQKYKYTRVLLMTPSDVDPWEHFESLVAYQNGYSEMNHAHHLMDYNNRHHYLPGTVGAWTPNSFIKFILLTEHQQLKPQAPGKKSATNVREFLMLPQELPRAEALAHFPDVTCIITEVTPDSVVLLTENEIYGTASHDICAVAPIQGDRVIAKGFTQRFKDKRTEVVTYTFKPLYVGPEIS